MNELSENQHPAVVRLYAFLTEMNRWEVQAIALSNALESLSEADYLARRKALTELRQRIFEEYVILKTRERVPNDSHGGREPDYDPMRESVLRVEESKSEVAIYTRSSNQFGHTYRYKARLKDGVWRLVNDRRYRDGDEWIDWPL